MDLLKISKNSSISKYKTVLVHIKVVYSAVWKSLCMSAVTQMLKNGKSDAAVPSMKPDPTSRFIYYLNKSFPYNMSEDLCLKSYLWCQFCKWLRSV